MGPPGQKRLLHLSLAMDDDSLLLCFLLLPFILRDTIEKVLTTARVLNVLDANVDSLGQNATPDNQSIGKVCTAPSTKC